ncbi:MAG: ATP-dependent sacrificial sulfur transferase LarE [Streptosporangiales bacterium]|nr:ATP-dependent sacrificial sulfur transferase LarE [Streptosporangiales bacterium]
MTLVDSRPGIIACLDGLAAETGTAIDSALAATRIGGPIEEELAEWFPAEQVPGATARFRALYPDLAIPTLCPLPGARAAAEAVHGQGGRVVVVTAKYEPSARRALDELGIPVDAVAGGRYAEAKGEALREHGATVYVGDHLGDVRAARSAGAVFVAIATGPYDAESLRAAGADTVLDDLTAFPEWLEDHLLDARLAELEARLRSLGGVLVAFSGGADSAFLLAAAVRALGARNVAAATAVSPSLPAHELAAAAEFARDLGVRHLTPRTHEMDRDGYRANAGDRCYFCKAELMDVLAPLADELGIAYAATGTNADDAVAGFRPGIRAAAERGAVTPLRDAGLTKRQVREASRRWGLRTWDKPAAACLSSRVAYGIEVTPHRLARVERAEGALRTALATAGIPVTNLRVRDLGEAARIEVDRPLVGRVADCRAATDAVRATGFVAVEVDPRGFRSGSMNELLPDPDPYR